MTVEDSQLPNQLGVVRYHAGRGQDRKRLILVFMIKREVEGFRTICILQVDPIALSM